MSEGERPLAGLTEAQIADRWGPLKAKAKKIDDEIDALKQEFQARQMKAAIGAKFTVVEAVSGYEGLDLPKIREEMGQAWCKRRSRWISKTTYDVRKVGEARPEAKPRRARAKAKAEA